VFESSFDLYIIIGLVAIASLSIVFNILQRRTISELNQRVEVLVQDAYYDPLTSLPNKNNFSIMIQEQIERAKRHEKSFLFMYIKLKHFKNEEDIKEKAKILSKCMRKEDFLAHIGEDEFVVLFNEYLEAENYEILIKRIVAAFPKYTIRVGTSLYPIDAKDKKYLLQKAKEDSHNGLY
jgi:diguanylate cyclase (GGDEF)-like protein